eukprot:CAMPEP_0203810856 /NCGR_PEP_ID=MMETSP0115-20131106/3196_1 /ASSEMBLY_ACC=CAM_ASM_000227 /TAXON_ID=33651 /ORGANISM="Bicosoecid sp, Strain ms1" /LENGTH=1074 /DNA_ID=CAMNT_0050719659 /DNA_START=56 /DNA_END=3276 /DNA_ORIENTATION=+
MAPRRCTAVGRHGSRAERSDRVGVAAFVALVSTVAVSAACHPACLPDVGCAGDSASQCETAGLVALERTTLAWALPDGSTRTAATLVENTAAIVGVGLDARSPAATAYALGADCTVWSADVTTALGASPPAASRIASADGRCVGLSASAVSATDAVFVVLTDGSVLRVPLNGDEATEIAASSAGATAVAAHPAGEHVYYGTADGVSRVDAADGANTATIVSALPAAVVALVVDATRGRVAWSTEDGDVSSADLADGGRQATLASGLTAAGDSGTRSLGDLAVVASGDAADSAASFLVGSNVPVLHPYGTMFKPDVMVELSAATEGAGRLASGTVEDNDLMGGWSNAVSAQHDVNGDGMNDALVGLHFDDDGATDAGSVLVLMLETDGSVKGQQKITSGVGLTNGATLALAASDGFGCSVAGMADWDGDGVPEAAVGARYDDDGGTSAGAVWLLFLTATGEARATYKISTQVTEVAAYNDFGQGLTAVPDIDGDGKQELGVGTHGDAEGGSARGAVYIVFLQSVGGVGGTAEYRAHTKIAGTGGAGFVPVSPTDAQWFGHGISAMTDAGGTAGVIAVGAHGDNDGGDNAGSVYLLKLSSPSSGAATVDSTSKLSPLHGGLAQAGLPLVAQDKWGASVTQLPDLDGNGDGELCVGTEATFVDVVFLASDGAGGNFVVRAGVRLSSARSSVLPAVMRARISTSWGVSVAGLGDVDGDGAPELAVANGYDVAGGANAGAVFILSMVPGGRLDRLNVDGDPPAAVAGQPALLVDLPLTWRGGVAAAARLCHADCAGDCFAGGTAFDCDAASGCGSGLVVSSIGDCTRLVLSVETAANAGSCGAGVVAAATVLPLKPDVPDDDAIVLAPSLTSSSPAGLPLPFRMRGRDLVLTKAPHAGSFDFVVTAYDNEKTESLALRAVVSCDGLTGGGAEATVAVQLSLSGFSAAQFTAGAAAEHEADDNIAAIQAALARAVGVDVLAASVTSAADVVDSEGDSAALVSVDIVVPASLLTGGTDRVVSVAMDTKGVAGGALAQRQLAFAHAGRVVSRGLDMCCSAVVGLPCTGDGDCDGTTCDTDIG